MSEQEANELNDKGVGGPVMTAPLTCRGIVSTGGTPNIDLTLHAPRDPWLHPKVPPAEYISFVWGQYSLWHNPYDMSTPC